MSEDLVTLRLNRVPAALSWWQAVYSHEEGSSPEVRLAYELGDSETPLQVPRHQADAFVEWARSLPGWSRAVKRNTPPVVVVEEG